MVDYVYVGKIINTFGIKGELKVNSNFEYQEKVFNKDFIIYIGEYKQEEVINTKRIHQNNLLITLNGYNNINDVLKYKGLDIYIKREDLKLKSDEYLLSDLIGFQVYDNDTLIGKVIDYTYTIKDVLLKIKGQKIFYIPKIDYYIQEIDLKNKKIVTNKGSDLIL